MLYSSTATAHALHGQYPKAESVEDFRRNLAQVRQRMALACERSGRDLSEVRLLPVSKTFAEADLRLAYAAGCDFLGENKVQEALRKAENLADLADLKWSVIGHLQSNKAKYVARFASEFQALDKLNVAQQLEKYLSNYQRRLDVFIQVNTSDEPNKYGLAPAQVLAFIEQISGFEHLHIKGLMTLAVFSKDAQRVRECFIRLRELQHQLRPLVPSGISIDELSMGMSGDFEIAIEEGATVVRVGQAIFGARQLPDSHYWPEPNA
ncbi:YggS family pyridoxal phosphate-dependent enzyme [Pseudomonas sp. F1_0610]|uniref:YggS family pyridoxal phosphate-dependent enzyme n=1 Tax=Pseudomonas sp. F1_0610 TaxID=3114284 RepID=UPI0039C34177